MSTTKKHSFKTGRIVGNHHVYTLLKNYQETRWQENSKRIGKPDNRYVWCSIEDLKAYLEMAEEAGADAVNIYFGVYPSFFPADTFKEDRQTVVFVATQQHVNAQGQTEHKDLYVRTHKGLEMIAFNMIQNPYPPRPSEEGTETAGLPIFYPQFLTEAK